MRFLYVLLFGVGLAVSSAPAIAAPWAGGAIDIPEASTANVVAVASTQGTATAKKKVATAASKAKSKKIRKLTPQELAAKAKADEKRKREAEARAKAEAKARLAAEAKAAKERKLAAVKAERERRIAERKMAEEARSIAKAKVEEERKVARRKAAEEKRLAKLRAEEARRQAVAKAAEDRRQAEISRLVAMDIARTGNNGELRSEFGKASADAGLFAGLFGGAIQTQSMLPETRALDAVLEQKQGETKFQVKAEFEPQVVRFSGYPRDTIVIDTSSRFLYLVESSSRARRYAIAVGREGLEFKGRGKIGDKQEWPRWIPTLDMQKREPEKYAQYKDGMPGGPDNPLGARAMYVYQGGKDTHIRIHGTNQPQTIGTNSSNGCFRMINDHVMDLYRRVKVGADVVVM